MTWGVPSIFSGAFQEVSFYYPMRPDAMVLKGLSFTVGAGQTVAMVGKSGAGKTLGMLKGPL